MAQLTCEIDVEYIPALSPDEQALLDTHFNISPVMYQQHEQRYSQKIATGEYCNFEDYLREYNLVCLLLLTS